MKKLVSVVIVAAIVLSVGTMSVFAAPVTESRNNILQKRSETCRGASFVDEDNDGVCDNYQSGQCQGKGQGKGQYNCQRLKNGSGEGLKNGQKQGNGQGTCGVNFVDEDGDGVCDNYQSGQCGNCQNSGNVNRCGKGCGRNR